MFARAVTWLARVPVNPMSLASSVLLLGSAVLPWMTLVSLALVGGLAFPVFGLQANLWDLSGPLAPIALKPIVPLATGLLVLAAAFAVLIQRRLGAFLSVAALLVFFGGTEGIFGVHTVGLALTVVAPGPGIEWAVAGLGATVISFRFRSRPTSDLFRGLRTSEVLAPVGMFLAGVFVAIDAVDHAAGGDPFAVLGSDSMELALHAMFIGSTAILAGAFLLRPAWFRGRIGSLFITTLAVGLALDGIFHATTGDIAAFVGHTGAEILAHVATYYGAALLAISRFRPRSP